MKIADDETWFFGYDNRNQLLWIQVYDAPEGGEQLWYVDYKYDYFGNRIEKVVNGAPVGPSELDERYSYDGWNASGMWNVWADLSGDDAVMTHYLRGDEVDEIFGRVALIDHLLWPQLRPEGEFQTQGVMDDGDGLLVTPVWHFNDRQMSLRDVYWAKPNWIEVGTHLVYDGFGTILSNTEPGWSGRTGYTGREYDVESGLQYNRTRYYDSTIGRWLSEDPIDFAAGDPNLYRYTFNSYQNASDPSGLEDLTRDGSGVNWNIERPDALRRPGWSPDERTVSIGTWSGSFGNSIVQIDDSFGGGTVPFATLKAYIQDYWSGNPSIADLTDKEQERAIDAYLRSGQSNGWNLLVGPPLPGPEPNRPFVGPPASTARVAPVQPPSLWDRMVAGAASFVQSWDNVLGNQNNGWFAQTSNGFAGFSDGATNGLTQRVRLVGGFDAVDYDTRTYAGGRVGGQIAGVVVSFTPAGRVITTLGQVGAGINAAEAALDGDYSQALLMLAEAAIRRKARGPTTPLGARAGHAPTTGTQSTLHGAERLADAARTLSEAELAAARLAHNLRQADGATVFIHQVTSGRFNVFVEGERGIITTFRHLDIDAVRRLAINYGWRAP